MNSTETLFDNLAYILEYPTDGYKENLVRFRDGFKTDSLVSSELLDAFVDYAVSRSQADLEEMYTRTFDFNTECALEIGWHLYGENYERGDFLVKMRDRLRRCGIEESCELPDHLTHVLAVIGRLNEEEAWRLAVDFVIPAMDKIIKAVSDKDNPYEKALKFIQQVLKEQYKLTSGVNNHG